MRRKRQPEYKDDDHDQQPEQIAFEIVCIHITLPTSPLVASLNTYPLVPEQRSRRSRPASTSKTSEPVTSRGNPRSIEAVNPCAQRGRSRQPRQSAEAQPYRSPSTP